jgi:thiol-disulfide isomerase/thioredoxin
MIFLHIDASNKNKHASLLDKYIEQGKNVFVLIYMEGCGPCNATRPEWSKIKNVLENKYKNRDNIVVVDVDQEVLDEIKNIKNKPAGFPTMLYISKNNNVEENYEDCTHIKEKDRSVDSFVNWIESKIKMQNGGGKKTLKRRKWSLKYKKSINCRRPKGFSQKQYCKYGRKKGKK